MTKLNDGRSGDKTVLDSPTKMYRVCTPSSAAVRRLWEGLAEKLLEPVIPDLNHLIF